MKSVALLVTVILLMTSSAWARSQGQGTACKSNLKNIGTACEMWAEDHGGRFPERLDLLVPDYLRYIPECPAAARDTYSETYSVSRGGHFYGVCCAGYNHGSIGLKPNQPGYNSVLGLSDPAPNVSLETCQAEMMRVVTFLGTSRLRVGEDPRQTWPSDGTAFPGCVTEHYSSARPGSVPYEVDFHEDGFEVLCLGHGHLSRGVPPLYPRYDSKKGFLPFKPLPARSTGLDEQIKQMAPVSTIVLLLGWFGFRRRRVSRSRSVS